MLHYLLLAVYTLLIVFLTWKIWKKTREIAFVIGIGLIYYWSLMGAWFIVYDELTGQKGKEIGLHYYHYFELLFPVHADNLYYIVCALYALFIVGVQLTILYFAKPYKASGAGDPKPVRINHLLLIGICVGAAAISFALVWKEILTAAKFGESIYIVTRMQPGRWFTFHQLLNQAAVVALYIGLIAYISGDRSRFITGGRSRWLLLAYAVAVILVEGYLLLLGNKREILFGGILGAIFYINNVRYRINVKALSIFIVIILIPLIFNDGLRSYSPKFLTRYFDTSGLEFKRTKEFEYSGFTMKNTTLSFLFSNEMFCAHFSMYGVLSHHVPLTYGSSLVSLGASMVPHALWKDRPEEIYYYYAREVHAVEGQGYTIHHATGWYLNFGVIGVLLGAFLMGWLWAQLHNRHLVFWKARFLFLRVLFVIGSAAFAAELPTVMRSGPEVYKALVFEALLLPAFIVFLAAWADRKKPAIPSA